MQNGFIFFFFQGDNMRALACAFLLLAVAPASALFLLGTPQPDGSIAVLCEGEGQAFLSTPSGASRALLLDSGGQARIFPQEPGPYTVSCGSEAKTVYVAPATQQHARASEGWGGWLLALALACAFCAVLALAARALSQKGVEFSKCEHGGRVRLRIFAGSALFRIRITDPDGGAGAEPLSLEIPHLAAGSYWEWEYERAEGGMPLAPAKLSASTENGAIVMVSSLPSKGGSANAGQQISPAKKQLPKWGG